MTYDPIVILPVLPEPPNTQTDAKPVFLEKADAFNPALKAWGEAFNNEVPKLNTVGQKAQVVIDHLDVVLQVSEASKQAISAKNEAQASASQAKNEAISAKESAERAEDIALGNIPDATTTGRGLVRYGDTSGTACQGDDPRLSNVRSWFFATA